jgi:hypothetical protein
MLIRPALTSSSAARPSATPVREDPVRRQAGVELSGFLLAPDQISQPRDDRAVPLEV